MNRIPFTVYDFFACLSSGAVIVGVMDYLYGYQWLLLDKINPVLVLFLVFISYITGHVIAHFSSLFLEQFLIEKLLKKPSRTLMGELSPRYLKWLFPGYYRALPKDTQQRIRTNTNKRGFSGEGEGLFLHVYAATIQDEKTLRRIDEFRNLYGFSRNLSFAFLFIAPLLWVGTLIEGKPSSYWWAIFAAVIGITMFYRYLKFFRQYSYHLFVTYAELPTPQ